MRLSQEAKAPVRPRDFGIAVAITTVALVGIGITSMPAGGGFFHNRPLMQWLNAGLLLYIWVNFVLALKMHGWRVFTWRSSAFLIGSTLWLVERLWPHPPSLVTWASNAGQFIMVASVMSRYFEFGKKREEAQPDAAG